jgi:hypothetical protein
MATTEIASHEHDLGKLRVFSLTVALVLITLSLAGVRLESPAKVQPLGVPLTVDQPELLSIGLVLASVYSVLRFIYFGLLVQPSPIRARSRLLLGSRANTSTTPNSFADFHAQISSEVHRYFPRVGRTPVTFAISQTGNEFTLKVTVPPLVRIVARFEDIDFLAPIWLNLFATALWLYVAL